MFKQKYQVPLMEYESTSTDGAHFKSKSTNTTTGYSKDFKAYQKIITMLVRHGILKMN